MMSARLTAILTAATMSTVLTGCGADDSPAAETPPAATETDTQTETPADPAPTSEAPSDPAETSTETTGEPTTDTPEGDLPTEALAYADAFVQAWVDQDQALLEQMVEDPQILDRMTTWGGQGWERVDEIEEEPGNFIVHYIDDQNMELQVWVAQEHIDEGEPGIPAAVISEGAYPIPTTVEDYASAFVNAAKEDDTEFLDQLGTDEAVASVPEWRDLDLGATEVSDGPDQGTAVVQFFSDGGVSVVVVVDVELAESGSEDAVLSAEMTEDENWPNS